MHKHLLHHHNTKQKGGHGLLIADILGWIGAVLLITAYVLLSIGVLDGQSLVYQLLNLFGALGLMTLGLARKAYPSVATNIVWLIIGVVTIVGILLVVDGHN